MKRVLGVEKAPPGHWVGDGFPVRTMFSYDTAGACVSPFLLLDYAAPAKFPPTEQRLGVGEHPHRGFETVTIVYQGELEHRDSQGNRGRIGPGDVQWMTAASGIVHEEMHGRQFAKTGGTFEVAQLWVNLPARLKMSKPGYQDLLARDIPTVALPHEAGSLRVISGDFQGTRGPARTFTPVNLWDLKLRSGRRAELSMPQGHTTALLILRGPVVINGSETAKSTELALFDREGTEFSLEAREDAVVLVMGGEPIDEPIAGRGPFVMNTEEEIRQAILDYQNGEMGWIGGR